MNTSPETLLSESVTVPTVDPSYTLLTPVAVTVRGLCVILAAVAAVGLIE